MIAKESGRSPGSPFIGLSEEDERIWAQVARTAKPLRRSCSLAAVREKKARPVASPSAKPKKSPEPPSRTAPQPRPPSPAPQVAVDRRSARQIATGRLEIDARLDLHGLYQSQAHARLRGFIAHAQDRGARHVLIITGKGGAAPQTGDGERGVLKRSVPVWLTEPPLNTIVLGWSPAHRRHGGDGALYVRLKKKAAL